MYFKIEKWNSYDSSQKISCSEWWVFTNPVTHKSIDSVLLFLLWHEKKKSQLGKGMPLRAKLT